MFIRPFASVVIKIMKRTLSILLALAIILSAFPIRSVSAQGQTYTVQAGDNLYRIALKFGTTVAALQTANGLTTTVVRIGQVLIIPGGSSVAAPAAAYPVAARNPGKYTVLSGDNLYRIALKFGTTVSAIQAANGLTATTVRVGQVLTIPGATGSSVPAPAATAAAAASVPGTYAVQSGDNLYRIALKFGTTVAAIQTANGLSSTTVRVGQVLAIPGGAPAASSAPPTAAPSSASPTATPQPAASVATTSGFELGGQVAGFSRPDLMTYAGMTWVKRQVQWNPGDSASGHFDVITDAHGKGFKILLSVKGNPDNTTSDKFASYATFVGDLAGAGADGIEVWNEMNIDREWQAGAISPAAYVPLLQQAYTAIKAKNGGTLVVSGAPAPTGYYGGCSGAGCDDALYVQGMVNAGALNYMDCLGIHYNEGVVSPTQTSGDPRGNPNHYTRYYQSMVDTYWNAEGGRKKLCFTELGYLSGQEWGGLPGGFLWKPPYNLTVAEQAQYLADATRLSRDQGKVRLMIVFNVDFTVFTDDPQAGFAMIRPGGSCPACDAVRAVTGGR